MAVSNQSVMNKMLAELQQAKVVSDEPEKWKVHIAHVKLLSELLLNENALTSNEEDRLLEQEKDRIQQMTTTSNSTQEDDTSIFDF